MPDDLTARAAGRALEAYCAAMMQPNGWSACLDIERRWGLDGLPPEPVTKILQRISDGEDPEAAEEAVLGRMRR